MTATRAARVTSASSKKLPALSGHERMAGKSTPVPWMLVDQFWLPATTCARVLACGATKRTPVDVPEDGVGVLVGERGHVAGAGAARRPA